MVAAGGQQSPAFIRSPQSLNLQTKSTPSLTKPRPDFIVGENGVTVPTSRAVLESGFQRSEFQSSATRRPGMQYLLPNGNKARIMEPSGPAPLRISFTNAKDGPINPFTGKPPQAPSSLDSHSRKEFVRERTHMELSS